MEASDFLYRIRNDFYLGRYLEVLEGFKDYRSSARKDNEFHAEFEIHLLLFKTMIVFLRNCEDVVRQNEGLVVGKTDWMDLFLKYYAPTLMPLSEEEGQDLLDELVVEQPLGGCSGEEFEELRRIFANYINFGLKRYSALTPISKTFRESYMEYQSIVFCAFEANRQYKDADKVTEDLKLINDEHVITHLLLTRKEMRNRRFDQSLIILKEIEEKFGTALKINSLRFTSLMGMQRFDEVG
jgi:hypothetical protein